MRFWKQTPRVPLVAKILPVFLAVVAPFHAQEPKPETTPEPTTEPGPGCVWKLSDGDNTVYLAGSVHLLRDKDYPLPSTYDLAYADSAKIIFEIDMADLTSKEGAEEMGKAGSYPADDSLKNHVTGETLERIVDYFASRKENQTASQLTAPVLNRLKPGMIFLMISAIEAQELGAKAELGLENHFFRKAVSDSKPTGGLETIAYQMSRFDEFTPEEIEDLIVQTLDELSEMPKILGDLISHWHDGDIEALDKLLNEEMDDEKAIRELLLTERNRNWIPEIEKALEGNENVIFIVGAAHLVGEGSVIEFLEKKGYTVERVIPEVIEQKKAA